MTLMVVGSIIHIVLCLFCVEKFELGIKGLAYATIAKDGILFVAIAIYTRCTSQVNWILQPIDRDAFRDWGNYLRVSIPSMAMLCSEWWAFEVIFILAGILGVLELGALSICLNVHSLLYRLPLGVTEATSALIGNSIGADNVRLAYRFAAIDFAFGGFCIMLQASTLIFGRGFIVNWFTEDEALAQMTETLMVVQGFVHFFNTLQCICHGPIRALCLQKFASWIAFGCNWPIGLPLAAIFAFKFDYGIFGLMAGFGVSSFLECVFFTILLKRKDWNEVAK